MARPDKQKYNLLCVYYWNRNTMTSRYFREQSGHDARSGHKHKPKVVAGAVTRHHDDSRAVTNVRTPVQSTCSSSAVAYRSPGYDKFDFGQVIYLRLYVLNLKVSLPQL